MTTASPSFQHFARYNNVGGKCLSHDFEMDCTPTDKAWTALQILAVNPSEEILEHDLEVFKDFLRAEILPVFARSTRRLEDIQASMSIVLQSFAHHGLIKSVDLFLMTDYT